MSDNINNITNNGYPPSAASSSSTAYGVSGQGKKQETHVNLVPDIDILTATKEELRAFREAYLAARDAFLEGDYEGYAFTTFDCNGTNSSWSPIDLAALKATHEASKKGYSLNQQYAYAKEASKKYVTEHTDTWDYILRREANDYLKTALQDYLKTNPQLFKQNDMLALFQKDKALWEAVKPYAPQDTVEMMGETTNQKLNTRLDERV